MYLQDIILTLDRYWAEQGCLIVQPYDSEMGAGTFHPASFLKALGPKAWNAAYVASSRRPSDGRYGKNPYRFQYYDQYHVLMKPSPSNIQELYLQSLLCLGIDPKAHDLRFVEENWESPMLAAWGLGWEVWMDGMEITQFTYFQQMGGQSCVPVSVGLSYGIERIAMYLQEKSHVYDIALNKSQTLGILRENFELQHCDYNFNHVNIDLQKQLFSSFESESQRLLELKLIYPAYEFVLKAVHSFNLLDARGVLSQTERQYYIQRLRRLAEHSASAYLDLHYPKEVTA